MKILTAALSLSATLLASQATALSCLRPDVALTFQRAADAEETYVVLLGQFDFDVPRINRSLDINNPVEVVADARFTGQSLGATGFQQNVPLDVTLVFACGGPWCGSLPDDEQDILAFVERTDAGYVLEVDPCFSTAFVAPQPSDVMRVEACMRGEECQEDLAIR